VERGDRSVEEVMEGVIKEKEELRRGKRLGNL